MDSQINQTLGDVDTFHIVNELIPTIYTKKLLILKKSPEKSQSKVKANDNSKDILLSYFWKISIHIK